MGTLLGWAGSKARRPPLSTGIAIFVLAMALALPAAGEAGPPPSSDPASVAFQLAKGLLLPAPTIQTNPDAGKEQLVNLPTWLWVDPSIPITRSSGRPEMLVVAEPHAVVWSMGTGDLVTCPGPGTPYDKARPPEVQSTSCSYTFRHPSSSQPGGRHLVTASVIWRISWVGSTSSGDFGLAFGPPSTLALRVVEVQAVNVLPQDPSEPVGLAVDGAADSHAKQAFDFKPEPPRGILGRLRDLGRKVVEAGAGLREDLALVSRKLSDCFWGPGRTCLKWAVVVGTALATTAGVSLLCAATLGGACAAAALVAGGLVSGGLGGGLFCPSRVGLFGCVGKGALVGGVGAGAFVLGGQGLVAGGMMGFFSTAAGQLLGGYFDPVQLVVNTALGLAFIGLGSLAVRVGSRIGGAIFRRSARSAREAAAGEGRWAARRAPRGAKAWGVAEQNAARRIAAEEGAGGHSLARHGSQTTLERQWVSSKTGLRPDGTQTHPVNSSRFLTHQDHLEVIERAKAIHQRDGGPDVDVLMDRLIGEGFQKGGTPYLQTKTARVSFRDGKVWTAYPLLRP